MTRIYVDRESHTTDARLFVPTVQMRDDTQVVAGANQPLVVRQDTIQSVIDGIVFYTFKLHPATDLLVSGDSIEFLVTTAANRPVGIGYVAQSGGNAEIYVYENVTDVVGGTLTVPLNRNRASDTTAVTGVLLNPTSYTLGPLIYADLILGGSGGNAAGSTSSSDYALLAANKSYLFRLTNTTNQDHTAELMIQWIENG